MEDYDDYMYPVCILLMLAACHQMHNRRRRTAWVRPWIQRRKVHGAYHALMSELAEEDPKTFKNFVRMDLADFEELLQRISPRIKKRDTVMRQSISPAERLSLTLRYLATGDSYQSISYLYRGPVSTLSKIIPETCDAIYKALKDEYLKVPSNEKDWENVAKEFEEKWNFPNCIGAMDGKHVGIKCPIKSGSVYYNYKQFFSIVLFAVVDADYKFLYVDVGCNGRISDGGVFANSSLFQSLESKSLYIPVGKPLPGREEVLPYLLVGDEAFPLKTYLMKPYPSRQLDLTKRIYNYRHSRARRIVENVFGILASRFRVFKSTICMEPEKAEKIVLACCALHNFLRTKSASKSIYSPPGVFDEESSDDHHITPGQWRQENDQGFSGLNQQGGNRPTFDARIVRDELCDYFNSDGQVPWQWSMI